jgi:hypothetical protein
MAKKKAPRAEEGTEAVLDGALSGTTRVADETPEVPKADRVPDINDPDWTGFVLSKLRPDELHDGCPDYFGLRRLADEWLGVVTGTFVNVVQAPNFNNGNHTCLVVSMTIDHGDYPWLGDYAGRSVTYGHAGDVFSGNGEEKDRFAWQHSSATCSTRAKAALLRDVFRLRHVYTREELSPVPAADSGADGYMVRSQFRSLDALCAKARLDVDAGKYVRGVWRAFVKQGPHDDLNRVPYGVAQRALALIQPWQQDRSKIKDEVRGYDPDWMKGVECMKA